MRMNVVRKRRHRSWGLGRADGRRLGRPARGCSGPVAALCVVVGSVIGSGIFIVPATVAARCPRSGRSRGLGPRRTVQPGRGTDPRRAGGDAAARRGPYVYLREAYGPVPAFLFGWTEFLVIRTGSMATLAAAFALYFSQIVPPPAGAARRGLAGGGGRARRWPSWRRSTSSAPQRGGQAPGGRHGAEGRGDRRDDRSCRSCSAVADPDRLAPVWPRSVDSGSVPRRSWLAMVGVLWTYDGWVNSTALAEEIRDPERNIPRAIIGGHPDPDRPLPRRRRWPITSSCRWPRSPRPRTEGGSPRAVAADFCQSLARRPGAGGDRRWS